MKSNSKLAVIVLSILGLLTIGVVVAVLMGMMTVDLGMLVAGVMQLISGLIQLAVSKKADTEETKREAFKAARFTLIISVLLLGLIGLKLLLQYLR